MARIATEKVAQILRSSGRTSNNIADSRYSAREKDRCFVREAIRHGLVDRDTLLDRLARTPMDAATRERLRLRLEADFREVAGG